MKFPRLVSLGPVLAGVSMLTCVSSCEQTVSQEGPPITGQRVILPPAPPARPQAHAAATPSASPAAASSPAASPVAAASPGASPSPTPTEIPAAIDITMTGPTVQISDTSLANAITYSVSQARAASMRVVEQARIQLVGGH